MYSGGQTWLPLDRGDKPPDIVIRVDNEAIHTRSNLKPCRSKIGLLGVGRYGTFGVASVHNNQPSAWPHRLRKKS